jgi:hypothetical protein
MDVWVPVLFLVVLGGLAVLVGLKKIVDANATASWPTTTATMLAAEVGKAYGANTYFWVADLSYRYRVGATTYKSGRYSATGEPGFFLRRTAQRIVEQHRPGSQAVVAYPPSDPSQGILAPGVQPVLIGALRILAMGLAILCLAWKFSKGF